MPFISIQLNGKRPLQLVEFLDNIEDTADRPEDIEVLLHIDIGDAAMEETVAREKARRRLALRALQTDLVRGYATLWKPLNPLFKMTHADVYFVANLFDEVRFKTKGWDSILRTYKHYYPDDIFRLRASRYRFRNYRDFWECGFAPDSLAFYTRRWLELGGDWNPCLGPDSFQQSVAFYLMTDETSSPQQFNRDIAVPDIYFTGEGMGRNLSDEAWNEQACINNKAWFVLMSHRMQQEAKRRAMRLKSYIIAGENSGEEAVSVEENERKRIFEVKNRETGTLIAAAPYRLSWLKISGRNALRAPVMRYYSGGGQLFCGMFKSCALVACSRIPYGDKIFIGLKRLCDSVPASNAERKKTVEFVSEIASGNSGRSKDALLISILVTSSNILHVTAFLDALERTASNPQRIEVIVGVTHKESVMGDAINRQVSARKVKLRQCETGDNSDGIASANRLRAACGSNAYFVAYLNDGILFETPGWDGELEKYIGYYPDHIFRLRCSQNRFRNYTRLEECALAPDTITFYTRDWLSAQKDFGSGVSPEIFQQGVAFYLFTDDPFSHTQYNREIALPHLRFTAENGLAIEDIPPSVRQDMQARALLLRSAIIARHALAGNSEATIRENKPVQPIAA